MNLTFELDPYESCHHKQLYVPHVTNGSRSWCLFCEVETMTIGDVLMNEEVKGNGKQN